MLPTHQQLFLDTNGNWVLSQEEIDFVPGAEGLEGEAKAEFVKQYYDEREEATDPVKVFEAWATKENISKAMVLSLQEPQTAPASTQVSYENGRMLSKGGNDGKAWHCEYVYYKLQENGGEADNVPQQEVEVAQPVVMVPKPKREHLFPRCDVTDRKMLPEFATPH